MRATNLLKFGVTVGIAGLMIVRVPVHALYAALNGVKPGWLLAALGLVAAMLAARGYRWHRMLVTGGVTASPADAARSLAGGFALSLATPGKLGELGRCLFLEESSRACVLMLNLLDRALDSWALYTYAVLGLLVLSPRPHGVFAFGVWLAFLPAVMGLPTFISYFDKFPGLPAGLREKIRQAKHRVLEIRVPTFASWAFLSTTIDLLTFYCLLRAFQPVSLFTVLTTFPFILIVGGLPIAISGLGPREGVAAVLLARYAVPSAVAIDATLLLWVFSAVLPAVAGGVWLLVSGASLPRFSFGADYTAATAEKQSA